MFSSWNVMDHSQLFSVKQPRWTQPCKGAQYILGRSCVLSPKSICWGFFGVRTPWDFRGIAATALLSSSYFGIPSWSGPDCTIHFSWKTTEILLKCGDTPWELMFSPFLTNNEEYKKYRDSVIYLLHLIILSPIKEKLYPASAYINWQSWACEDRQRKL